MDGVTTSPAEVLRRAKVKQMLGCEIVGAVGDSRHAEKVGSSNALLRPCSSTPNFQNCGDDRQCGYTDRTRVRTPHEPNERVAVPTVGVS